MRRKYTVRDQVARGEFRFRISLGQLSDWPVLQGQMRTASPTELAPLYDKCARVGGRLAAQDRRNQAGISAGCMGAAWPKARRPASSGFPESRLNTLPYVVNDILGILRERGKLTLHVPPEYSSRVWSGAVGRSLPATELLIHADIHFAR